MTTSPRSDRPPLNLLSSIAFLALLVGSTGCGQKGTSNRGGSDVGTTGDYVNGTPLPERREGTSFFGGNVQRGQFHPIYFDFDSSSIAFLALLFGSTGCGQKGTSSRGGSDVGTTGDYVNGTPLT